LRRRRAASVLLLLGAGLAPWSAPLRASETVEANLEVVGRSDLGGASWFGAVAVIWTTAIVAADPPGPGTSCQAGAKVVDVKDPKQPGVVAELDLPAGMGAADIDVVPVATDTFTGDVAAIALARLPGCPVDGGDDLAYYDVTDPAAPRPLGRAPACPGCPAGARSVSLAERADGRVLSVRATVDVVVVEDRREPARGVEVARWIAPPPAPRAGCPATAVVQAVELHDDGQGALVVLADGRVFDLDLADPAAPVSAEGTPPPTVGPAREGTAFAAVMPVGAHTVAAVAEDGLADACTEAPNRGLRTFELTLGATPVPTEPVQFPGPSGPGRLVASGELVYATWHAQGLRVLDLGQVRPRAVAQFIPADADVVGVGLLPDHIVVTDRTSGLYVLERPDEAGREPSFWSEFTGLLPYIGGAGVMTAAFVVPRLAMGRSPLGSRARVPVPSRAPRRRA
jgi:hypothetical protein